MAVERSCSELGVCEPVSRHPVATRPLLAQMAAKHAPTYHHMGRVSGYAEAFATELRLSRAAIRFVSMAALLHDIGKLEIPLAILTKPSRLTSSEMDTMCRHAERGAEILAGTPALAEYAEVVRHHHEWYDGRGYCDGLAGEEIPWVSRVISICDAFDTMTTPRPYTRPISVGQALAQIELGAGTQFDPELARLFVDRFRNGRMTRVLTPVEPGTLDQRPVPLALQLQR